MKKIPHVLLLTCVLAACAPARSPASAAVEKYLQALSDKNEEILLDQVCPEYEFDALVEFDALAQVKTKLKDVSCRQIDADENSARVTCVGSIVSNYGSEFFSYELGGRIYTVVENGGHWLVCGYTR